MPLQRRKWLSGLGATLLLSALNASAQAADAPALMLAGVYRPGMPLAAYWLSEKYDGLRAFWDGQRLLSRGGETIVAPAWFTAGWPAEPMDGELWAGRGRFEEALSTVRQQTPNEEAWRRIRFMVFDMPAHPGPFSDRITAYHGLVSRIDQPWVRAVPQERVPNHAVLMARLDRMVKDGGEGLMLHKADSHYRAVRSDDLLKVKTHDDAEARVIGYVPGQGRHAGRMGALLVQTPAGLRFRLGTGFTDAQRERPPAVGEWVTYRFRGINTSGVPRFASFVRMRPDAPG
ncbi:DNA ligase [Hydrogenophaga sp. BPS33]|uniref:DNA ligase n=1 Tax=Hydrogenophaga sp. BPS33 TaxID=2651974 RepID=UPI00131F9105|nr:DNA ligase [Hydrogenophaga sp. BPS33]QHE86206.1 DNA ligase [Hydrogenophaga sp. BPS33]